MAETSIKPNSGASIGAADAFGEDRESQATWFQKNHVKVEDRIRLKKLSHMRYQHPDLDEIHKFMLDFGMQAVKRTENEIWYRGYGKDQYVYYARKGPKKFLGGTFELESETELEKAKSLPHASPVEELTDAPGGGKIITFTDLEGFPCNLIFGQEPVEANENHREKIVLNYADDKPRRNKFNRFQPGPAAVHKLGHFGFCTQKFDDQLHFYTSHFNLVPTDFLYIKQGDQRIIVGMFAHIDLGEAHSDHHSFFLNSNPEKAHVHHCSFEVHDYDTQQLGHQWLAQQGYKSVWGIGRHVLGSQIFDYWWDTTGNMVEHYADSDLVNKNTPIGYVQAGSESLAVWGPEVPPTFLA